MKEEAEVIATYLIGTDSTIHAMANELGIDMDEFYRNDGPDYLYDLVDQCDECGKWFDLDDMKYDSSVGRFICKDCLG